MDATVLAEIEELRLLRTAALQTRYRELFGVETHSSNKQFLFRRIAWRLQARAEGDLSERAHRRAVEVADDVEIRLRAPKQFLGPLQAQTPAAHARRRPGRDWRLPPIGTVLTRQYHHQLVQVRVHQDDFEYQGRRYPSLSAIAREVTGTRWNGLAFFHLTEPRRG